MEKEIEEKRKPKKDKLILANPDWLDLPDLLVTDVILEHLEIFDYIRFAAVCKKWQSIQNEHRVRYFPYSPPLPLAFPWLVCISCISGLGRKSFHFYVPDRHKSYDIPFFETSKCRNITDHWYGYGWLILKNHKSTLCIFNPVSRVEIKLPPVPDHTQFFFGSKHISSSPSDPDCTILIDNGDGKFFLYRLNDNGGWKTVDNYSRGYPAKALFCRNKIYHVEKYKRVIMVDTLLPDPVVQTVEMDCSEINEPLYFFDLVDFFGELVMVISECGIENFIHEFHVYRADFLRSKWVRIDTLGDGVIFKSPLGIFALRGDNVACKKNTIYLSGSFLDHEPAWRAFDVSSRCWTDGPSMSISCSKRHRGYSCGWFLPSLDYYLNVTDTEGGCQIMIK